MSDQPNFSQNGIETIIANYLSQQGFQARKVTDRPTDSLSVTPASYINQNGKTDQRPTKPFKGEQYFDTTLGYPVFYNGSNWVNGSGDSV